MYTLFSSYVMFFYTDVILVNAAIIGTAILISRVFDGVSDLIAGRWIDTHSGKWGHCMSVIVKWSIPMALSVLAVFTVPDATIPKGWKIAFISGKNFWPLKSPKRLDAPGFSQVHLC